MFEDGLVEEVNTLLEMRYDRNIKSMQSIGYRHTVNYILGEWDLQEASHEFERNPINAILSGPIGTSPGAFPSRGRGISATPSGHLDMLETSAPLEEHGFTLVDFLPDRAVVRQYKWDVNSEPLEALDTLEPFFTTELEPPA